MKQLIKKIIIGIVILVVGVMVYNFIFKKEASPAVGLSSTNTPVAVDTSLPTDDSVVGSEFLSILLNLKNIKLDDSLFASPSFSNLKDFTINLVQEGNQGRNNPFAPLGVDQVISSTTNTSTNSTNNSLDNTPRGNSSAPR